MREENFRALLESAQRDCEGSVRSVSAPVIGSRLEARMDIVTLEGASITVVVTPQCFRVMREDGAASTTASAEYDSLASLLSAVSPAFRAAQASSLAAQLERLMAERAAGGSDDDEATDGEEDAAASHVQQPQQPSTTAGGGDAPS